MVMENTLLYSIHIGDFPITTSLHRGFSIAMFDYQRVFLRITLHVIEWTAEKNDVLMGFSGRSPAIHQTFQWKIPYEWRLE